MMNPNFWDIIHFDEGPPDDPYSLYVLDRFQFIKLTQDEFEKREELLAPEWMFMHEGLLAYGCIHYFYPKEKYWVYAKGRGIIK